MPTRCARSPRFDELFPKVPPLPPEAFRPESRTLKLGPHSRDATSERSGKTFALVGAESFRRDAALLAELTPWQQDIVRLAMQNNPALSLAETIEMLIAFGL
jgi:hypothetical protein